ncbi:MAG TPA: PH domain-containing protein [Burkholderiales bacterium]|nr:PH domain-containing protein [Burkholderiales bacterium]
MLVLVVAVILIASAGGNRGHAAVSGIGVVFMIIAGALAFSRWLARVSSEFAVTNKRVLIKVGFIRRHSLELLLQKVEGIGVDQGIWGRVFDYGTIMVTGTGGTKEPFKNIAAPLEFRKQVQSRVTA